MEEGRVASALTLGRGAWAGVWKSLKSAPFIHRNRRPCVVELAELIS